MVIKCGNEQFKLFAVVERILYCHQTNQREIKYLEQRMQRKSRMKITSRIREGCNIRLQQAQLVGCIQTVKQFEIHFPSKY